MVTEIRVPTLGESVSEATVGRWFKNAGDIVKQDEPLVELETDKVSLEVNAPISGTLGEIVAKAGENVVPGALLGSVIAGEGAEQGTVATTPRPAIVQPAPIVAAASVQEHGPAVGRLAKEMGIDPNALAGTGKDGRTTKGDMLAALASVVPATPVAEPVAIRPAPAASDADREERVRMTRLRQTIARRLKEVQATAAMLTTFNDVDMSAVIALRSQYKEAFENKHGVKLGFMGLFTKAVVQALKDIPAINAEIDGPDIVFKNYYHIGVAVGTDRGLVVPVVRDADLLSVAGIEKKISDFGKRARDGQLKIEEMQGGTFTITNGGIYGSLMSTPILNAPQSGILGMHRIEERPVGRNGQIVLRPMMYLALSYDHRIVDGKEAVTFLVRVKEALEDPARLVLDL